MGLITWTDSLSNGDNVTQTHITNLKSDVTTAVNGNLTNVNINASAAIAESKITFSTTGHTHNGTDANYPLIKHYRRGMAIKQGTDNEDVVVTPGVMDIGGKLLVSTAASSNIDIVSGTWADGGSRPASGPIYVYAYNNSGAVGFALSAEPPDLSDSSDGTAEFPLRYQKYSTTYYRLVGIAHTDASSDLQPDMYNNFDLSTFATGSFIAAGTDYAVYTGWSPDVIQWIVCSTSAPATGEAIDIWGWVQRYGFNKTGDANPDALYYNNIAAAPTHLTSANGTANTVYNVYNQTTSRAGSFTIDAPTNTQVVMWMAWSKGDSGTQAS